RRKAPPSTDTMSSEPNASPETGPHTFSGAAAQTENVAVSNNPVASASMATKATQQAALPPQRFAASFPGFIFSGVLLGLLPMWNSAVFLAAFAVLALLFILFPLKLHMLALAVTTGVIALPQMLYLTTWVIIANLFVAFALWRLWHLSLAGTTLPGRLTAAVLFLLVIPGGIIDFFPIHNTGWSEVTYRNDPFIDWLKKETKPRDIFLTDRIVNHPIRMAGRRVFYGWPYYALGAGYAATSRDRLYIDLFETRDPWKLFRLSQESGS